MSKQLFQQDQCGQVTLKAYVWKTEDGWAADGLISKDNGYEVTERLLYANKDIFDSREEAGVAIWKVLQKNLA